MINSLRRGLNFVIRHKRAPILAGVAVVLAIALMLVYYGGGDDREGPQPTATSGSDGDGGTQPGVPVVAPSGDSSPFV